MKSLEAYNYLIDSITSNEEIDENIVALAEGEYITALNTFDFCDFFGIDEEIAESMIELNENFGGDFFYKDINTDNIYQFDGCFFMDSCKDEILSITSDKAYTLLYEANEEGEELDEELIKIAVLGGHNCDSFDEQLTLLF